VFDVDGRLVRTLTSDVLPAGEHEVIWRGDDELGCPVGSGVYFYRLESDGVTELGSMVLLR